MTDIKNPFFIDSNCNFDEIAKIVEDDPTLIGGRRGVKDPVNMMMLMGGMGGITKPTLPFITAMLGDIASAQEVVKNLLSGSSDDLAKNPMMLMHLANCKEIDQFTINALENSGISKSVIDAIVKSKKPKVDPPKEIKFEISKIGKFLSNSKNFGMTLSSNVNLGISQNENLDANLKMLFDALNVVSSMHSHSQTFISFLKSLKLGNGVNDILAAIIDDASTMDALFKAESISGMYFCVAPDANDYESILNIVLLLDEGKIGVSISSILNRNVDSPARLMWLLTTRKSFIDEYSKIKFEISEKDVSKIMARAVEFVEKANAKAPQCPNDAAAKAMRDVCGLGTSINVMQKIGGKKQTDDALVRHFEEAALSYALSFKNLEAIGERIIVSTKDIDIAADAIDKILEQTEQKLHSQFTHLREGIIAKKKIAP